MVVCVQGDYVQPNELNPGDKFFAVFPEETFFQITSTGSVEAISGRFYRNLEGTRFIVSKKANIIPEHYPPQEGDVWRIGTTEYHILGGNCYNTGPSPAISVFHFKTKVESGAYKPVLVYRRGNALRLAAKAAS